MGLMKGDMGGAAVVCATMMAIAELKLPINVVGLTPLCENMPSGNAYKPGDVVTAMNGTTIEVCELITCIVVIMASGGLQKSSTSVLKYHTAIYAAFLMLL